MRRLILALLCLLLTYPPALAQDLIPTRHAAITPANAAQVQQIGILGRGFTSGLQWQADGQLLVFSQRSLSYNPDNLAAPPHLQHELPAPSPALVTLRQHEAQVEVLDAQTGQPRFSLDIVYEKAWISPDSALIAFEALLNPEAVPHRFLNRELLLVDSHSGTLRQSLPVEGRVYSIDMSGDNQRIAVSTWDFLGERPSAVRVWDIDSGTMLTQLSDSAPQTYGLWYLHEVGWHIAFSPDSARLAGVTSQGSISIWDSASGEVLDWLPYNSFTRSLIFTPDSKKLVSYNFGTRVWDLETGAEYLLGNTYSRPERIQHQNGKSILSLLSTRGGPGYFDTTWDLETLAVIAESPAQPYRAISPSRTMAIHRADGRDVFLVDLPTGNRYRLPFDAFQFVSDDLLLFRIEHVGSATLSYGLWYLHENRSFVLPTASFGISYALHPTENILAITHGNPGEVTLWQIEYNPFRLLERSTLYDGIRSGGIRANYESNAIAFSPDGSLLAVAGDPPYIRLWDTASGHLLATLAGHTEQVLALAFSPDATLLASSGGRSNRGSGDSSTDSLIHLWGIR